VALVAFTGLRTRRAELAALGVTLPGLRARAAAIGQLPALGLLTLAGLTPDDWSQSYHEFDPSAGGQAALVAAVAGATLVAVSALSASIGDAYAFADAVRAAGGRVAIGGLHVTACPEEAAVHADAVVVGEGEPVWAGLLGDAASGTLQRRYQAAAPFDLAQSPEPRFDLLGDRDRPRFTIQTQRGCPLACEFCGASRLLGKFREKPAALVARDLAALARHTPHRFVELADDNTFAGGRDHGALLDALRTSGARWFTEGDWRIGSDPALVQALAAAGCVQILVGLEAIDHRHPGMGPKTATWEAMMAAVETIQAHGVAVIGCFLAGNDGETPATIDHLVATLLDSPLADVQLTLPTPFPGTPLRARLEADGRLLPDRDWSHHTLFDVCYQPDAMTVAELELGFRRALQRLFAPDAARKRARIRRTIWRRAAQERRACA
jgi:radical SAM superfamily enzyme YgiQ (UPF0313 family)